MKKKFAFFLETIKSKCTDSKWFLFLLNFATHKKMEYKYYSLILKNESVNKFVFFQHTLNICLKLTPKNYLKKGRKALYSVLQKTQLYLGPLSILNILTIIIMCIYLCLDIIDQIILCDLSILINIEFFKLFARQFTNLLISPLQLWLLRILTILHLLSLEP